MVGLFRVLECFWGNIGSTNTRHCQLRAQMCAPLCPLQYAALSQVLVDRAFGAAGDECLVEERIEGPEVSLLAFTDGRTLVGMPAAQDHKRVGDGDSGPNTGGMGAYAPAPVLTPELRAEALSMMQTVVDNLSKEGRPYKGVLYGGFMLTAEGPSVLEFNCRFGDPETQACRIRVL